MSILTSSVSGSASRPAAARVAIAAGGTGGHIMPALAAAEAIRALEPEAHVEFFCGRRPVELAIYREAGESPVALPCGDTGGASFASLRRAAAAPVAALAAARALRALRPDAVLGMGGYVCAPVLLAARALGVPVYLHESNAIPGRITRLFAPGAREVFLGFAAAAGKLSRRARPRVTGTPVRAALATQTRESAAAALGLDPRRFTILALGGSQGARALNEAILKTLPALDLEAEAARDIQFLWSAGAANYESVNTRLSGIALPSIYLEMWPSITRMDAAYACSDLVISRAGASTLAELTALGLPAILVPLPTARDDHQRANARALADAGAALVVEEGPEFAESLLRAILTLMRDPRRLESLAGAARRLAAQGAAREIACRLLGRAAQSAESSSSFASALAGAAPASKTPLEPAKSL